MFSLTFQFFPFVFTHSKSLSLTYLLKNCNLFHVLITLTRLLSDASLASMATAVLPITQLALAFPMRSISLLDLEPPPGLVSMPYSHLHDFAQYRTSPARVDHDLSHHIVRSATSCVWQSHRTTSIAATILALFTARPPLAYSSPPAVLPSSATIRRSPPAARPPLQHPKQH